MISAMLRVVAAVLALSLTAFAQHDHMQMHMAHSAGIKVENDAATHTLTVTLGPLHLPANTSHEVAEQIPPQTLVIPFDGWITAYHPALVAPDGQPIPGRLLHHVAFYNAGRSDFLCPNKLEHIFGAGGEMNDWPALPSFGYRVHPGDRILIQTMFHNPTATSYPQTLLRVQMEYAPANAGLKSVYPAWFDVQGCGESDFALGDNAVVKTGNFTLDYSGRLLGVGGHMHDYGQELTLTDNGASVADLHAKLDDAGHILSIPIVIFLDRGGYPLAQGDKVVVTGTYEKPITPDAHGMAIVVGYFLPNNDADMAGLVRK